MDAERIDRWCERGILGLTLLILVFAPLAIGAVRSSEFVYVQGATILIAFLWLVRVWTRPAFEVFWPPICWPVLAFLGYALYRYLTADLEYIARLEFIKICVYAILFLAVVNNLHRPEQVQIISWTLIAVATFVSVYALIQFATHATHTWNFLKPQQYIHRGSGSFINPNNLAGFLELVLPVALAIVLVGRIGHVARIILSYSCVVLLVGIGVTLSRGGWMSTGLMLLCFFVALFVHTRSRWLIISVVLVSFLGTALYLGNSLEFRNRFERTFVGGKVEDARFDYWKPTVRMWQDHLWTGVGPAHFDEHFAHYRPREAQGRPQYAHNDYLNTLADWGIVGATIILSFVGLFYLGVWRALKQLRRKTESNEGKSNRVAFVFGVGFAVLAILFHSVTDFNLQIPANAIVLVCLSALAATHLRSAERFWLGGIPAKLVLSIFLIAMIGVVGFYEVRKVRENFWIARAQRAKTFAEQLAHYKKAVASEPTNFDTVNLLGDLLRTVSFQGDAGYEKQAEEAIRWYQRAAELNHFSPYPVLGIGMCLDWLGKTKEAGPYFAKASELDPNSYYIISYQGWHLVNLGDYAGAQKRFEESLGLFFNTFAVDYLEIVRGKLASASAQNPVK